MRWFFSKISNRIAVFWATSHAKSGATKGKSTFFCPTCDSWPSSIFFSFSALPPTKRAENNLVNLGDKRPTFLPKDTSVADYAKKATQVKLRAVEKCSYIEFRRFYQWPSGSEPESHTSSSTKTLSKFTLANLCLPCCRKVPSVFDVLLKWLRFNDLWWLRRSVYLLLISQ